jgi:hypothetical protein
MPSAGLGFCKDVDEAAERIVQGGETSAFEISFTTRFACLLKLLRLIPYRLDPDRQTAERDEAQAEVDKFQLLRSKLQRMPCGCRA